MPKKKTKTPKYVTETVRTYSLKKSLEKLFIQALIVAVVAFMTYFVDTAIPELMLQYPEYIMILTAITALLAFIINVAKHYNDTKVAKVDAETGEIVEYLN